MPYLYCEVCKKKVYRKPSHVGVHVYCSNGCRGGRRNGEYRNCTICNKKVYRTQKYLKLNQTGTFLCSKQYYSGVKHKAWKDGNRIDYREKMLKSNKKQMCLLCKATDQRILAVHHIDHDRSNNKPH